MNKNPNLDELAIQTYEGFQSLAKVIRNQILRVSELDECVFSLENRVKALRKELKELKAGIPDEADNI